MKLAATGCLSLLLAAQVAWADPTSVTSTKSTQSQGESAEQANARYWGLTVNDYRRYQGLMRGVRGSFSDPKITPIEVLGIHAANDAERKKYAEMFARIMVEDATRIAAFQEAYRQAQNSLFPNLRVVDLKNVKVQPSPQKTLSAVPSIPTTGIKAFATSTRATNTAAMSQPSKLTSGDRVLFFTSADCDSCNSFIQRALSLASSSTPVDVFVVGATTELDVQRYAMSLGIDPDIVKSGAVTLNIDKGTYAKVLPWKPDLPQVVRKRGVSLQQLNTTEL